MMKEATTLEPFAAIDYRDHFRLGTTEEVESVEAFMTGLALRQPRWLTKLSLGLGDPQKLSDAVGDGTFGVGSAIGNWKILYRGDTVVVLGEEMPMMTYRLRYAWIDTHTVEAETTVMYTKWFGKLYWRLASPMHRRLLPLMMRNAVTGGRTAQLA